MCIQVAEELRGKKVVAIGIDRDTCCKGMRGIKKDKFTSLFCAAMRSMVSWKHRFETSRTGQSRAKSPFGHRNSILILF